ncbi:hypothetical protein NPIL_530061 [Nephila pilipes]|uniref:Uncharacterized protein n=1 Tax=Nephila pilipes TaxID=299642 RepID=A0A8X6MQU7_NEPPI|nr:hypothetical protein NPIL_530061 [Nephila pilipes]
MHFPSQGRPINFGNSNVMFINNPRHAFSKTDVCEHFSGFETSHQPYRLMLNCCIQNHFLCQMIENHWRLSTLILIIARSMRYLINMFNEFERLCTVTEEFCFGLDVR